jgi:hypothetical protein
MKGKQLGHDIIVGKNPPSIPNDTVMRKRNRGGQNAKMLTDCPSPFAAQAIVSMT